LNPLVSICIPTFNGASFIEDALNSALAQTYKNIEIVVSDDASNDTTLQIVKNYQDITTIPIRVYQHQPNCIGSNWNHCIKHAQGEYIKFLFQDDVLMPKCIEKMIAVLNQKPQCALVACKRQFITEAGMDSPEIDKWKTIYGDLQVHLNMASESGQLILSKKLFSHPLFYASPFNKIGEPSVVMFRKSILGKTGYFREDLKQILDYEYWYRILKQYPIAIITEPLVKFRLHESQATNLNRNKTINDYKIYENLLYNDYFWLLHPMLRKRLFNKYHIIPRGYKRIKQFIKTKILN